MKELVFKKLTAKIMKYVFLITGFVTSMVDFDTEKSTSSCITIFKISKTAKIESVDRIIPRK